MTMQSLTDPAAAAELLGRFQTVRARSVALAVPLSAEDCIAQSMPDASPTKWHLAHTTWFFETFLLEAHETGFAPFMPVFRVLFNSYYNGVGAKHPRAQRGLLTRPSLTEVLAYRANVDERMVRWLSTAAADAAPRALVELGLQHEQQHQELLLTDVLHLLSCNPTEPAYAPVPGLRDALLTQGAQPLDWVEFPGGMVELGHTGAGFCFDNELPHHRSFLTPYALGARLVNNAEYAAFVQDGGYQMPALWLAEGWDWLSSQQIRQPLYWRRGGDADHADWRVFGLHGASPLAEVAQAPVSQLSYFEADAYARWAGARLPTEIEWEAAAALTAGEALATVGSARSGLAPQPAEGTGMRELFGEVWQWTQSSYAPYPGFRAAEGAVGEYNGKFMVNQYVLRGSSCATPPGHARLSYRNFFPTSARWQFSGLRLARDL